jgi:hypothetical protein
MFFIDDAAGARELQANASRIEGWRRTNIYKAAQQDFQWLVANSALQGFDFGHQIYRFRVVKNMPDAEVELIMRTLLDNVKSYEQVVEVRRTL